MKQIIAFFILFLCIQINAQDTLLFRDDSKIAAKVFEINIETIKYKKIDNLEGPDFIINKSDIKKIIFANGVIDTFSIAEKSVEMPNNNSYVTSKYSKIEYKNNHYYFVDQPQNIKPRAIGISKIKKTTTAFANENSLADLKLSIKGVRKAQQTQIVCGSVGAGCIAASYGVGLVSLWSSTAVSEDGNDDFANGGYITAASLLVGGLSLEVTSIVYNIKRKNRLKKTVELYNSHL